MRLFRFQWFYFLFLFSVLVGVNAGLGLPRKRLQAVLVGQKRQHIGLAIDGEVFHYLSSGLNGHDHRLVCACIFLNEIKRSDPQGSLTG